MAFRVLRLGMVRSIRRRIPRRMDRALVLRLAGRIGIRSPRGMGKTTPSRLLAIAWAMRWVLSAAHDSQESTAAMAELFPAAPWQTPCARGPDVQATRAPQGRSP